MSDPSPTPTKHLEDHTEIYGPDSYNNYRFNDFEEFAVGLPKLNSLGTESRCCLGLVICTLEETGPVQKQRTAAILGQASEFRPPKQNKASPQILAPLTSEGIQTSILPSCRSHTILNSP